MSIGHNCRKQSRAREKRRLLDKEQWKQAGLDLKSHLTRFWQHCNRLDMTPAARLARLKEFAEIVIATPLTRIRRFQRARFVSGFCPKGKFCFGCEKRAKIRHHIIQLQNGGNNSKLNIVSLCLDCHAEIHPWLQPVSKLITPANNESGSQSPPVYSQNDLQAGELELKDLRPNPELLAPMDEEGLCTYKKILTERTNNPLESELIPNCPERPRGAVNTRDVSS